MSDENRALMLARERSWLLERLEQVNADVDEIQSSVPNQVGGFLTLSEVLVNEKIVVIAVNANTVSHLTICWVDKRGVMTRDRSESMRSYSLASLGVLPNDDGVQFSEYVAFRDDPACLRVAIEWLKATWRHGLVRLLEDHLREEHGLQILPVEDGGFAFASTNNLTDPGRDLLL